MARLIYSLLLGLVGAAIVHIAVLLLVPAYSERDAWSRLAAREPEFQLVRMSDDAAGGSFLKGADPLFAAIGCRFNLFEGVTHLRASGELPFWSVSVYDRRGHNIYSFNDRTATDRKLDMVVTTPARMVELRKELPEAYSASVFVETTAQEGMVVVRLFVPDDSWSALVSDFIENMECRRE